MENVVDMCRGGPRRTSGTISQLSDVMVNFIDQLGWATGPRCVFKHYSGCTCEGAFGEFQSVDFE